MIDIGKKAQEVLKTLGVSSFRGIDIESHMETPEEWNEDYAIFILLCDIFSLEDEQNEYVKFDSDKFYADLREYLYEQFGGPEEVKIDHYPACDEWEIIRKKKATKRVVKKAAPKKTAIKPKKRKS